MAGRISGIRRAKVVTPYDVRCGTCSDVGTGNPSPTGVVNFNAACGSTTGDPYGAHCGVFRQRDVPYEVQSQTKIRAFSCRKMHAGYGGISPQPHPKKRMLFL